MQGSLGVERQAVEIVEYPCFQQISGDDVTRGVLIVGLSFNVMGRVVGPEVTDEFVVLVVSDRCGMG